MIHNEVFKEGLEPSGNVALARVCGENVLLYVVAFRYQIKSAKSKFSPILLSDPY